MEKTTEEKIEQIEKEILRLIEYKRYLVKKVKQKELHKKEEIFRVSKKVVLRHFEGITEKYLLSGSRKTPLPRIKKILYYLLNKEFNIHETEVGKELNVDRATVSVQAKNYKEEMDWYKDEAQFYCELVEEIKEALRET